MQNIQRDGFPLSVPHKIYQVATTDARIVGNPSQVWRRGDVLFWRVLAPQMVLAPEIWGAKYSSRVPDGTRTPNLGCEYPIRVPDDNRTLNLCEQHGLYAEDSRTLNLKFENVIY